MARTRACRLETPCISRARPIGSSISNLQDHISSFPFRSGANTRTAIFAAVYDKSNSAAAISAIPHRLSCVSSGGHPTSPPDAMQWASRSDALARQTDFQASRGSRLHVRESSMFCLAHCGGGGLAGVRGVRFGPGVQGVAHGGFENAGGNGDMPVPWRPAQGQAFAEIRVFDAVSAVAWAAPPAANSTSVCGLESWACSPGQLPGAATSRAGSEFAAPAP
jgi:hypothetical protein